MCHNVDWLSSLLLTSHMPAFGYVYCCHPDDVGKLLNGFPQTNNWCQNKLSSMKVSFQFKPQTPSLCICLRQGRCQDMQRRCAYETNCSFLFLCVAIEKRRCKICRSYCYEGRNFNKLFRLRRPGISMVALIGSLIKAWGVMGKIVSF